MGKEAPAQEHVPANAAEGEAPSAPDAVSVREQLASVVSLLQKAVGTKDNRLSRLLRQTAAIRKRLTPADLRAFVRGALPPSLPTTTLLEQALEAANTSGGEDGMDTDVREAAAAATAAAPLPDTEPLPELEVYALLLVLMLLVDRKQWLAVRSIRGEAGVLAGAGGSH